MSKTSSLRCLITAGPTREFIDPVRFISNPSTGKMGYALAQSAIERNWTVDLVSGPVSLTEPDGVIYYPVVSAEEMYHQVDALFDACDIFIMCAAVSDFRPLEYKEEKVKKDQAERSLRLTRTLDILKTMSQRKVGQYIAGFAAETHDLAENAKAKLISKACDCIIANQIGEAGSGFASDTNTVTLFHKSGEESQIGPTSKTVIAQQIIQTIAQEVEGES
jgi:phosphopantothenoylcysteine decarboxylase/phosphopantothenate--cysteine ligase